MTSRSDCVWCGAEPYKPRPHQPAWRSWFCLECGDYVAPIRLRQPRSIFAQRRAARDLFVKYWGRRPETVDDTAYKRKLSRARRVIADHSSDGICWLPMRALVERFAMRQDTLGALCRELGVEPEGYKHGVTVLPYGNEV